MNRDIGVTELFRTHLPEWTVPVFELVSMLGDELVVVVVLLVLAGVDAYRSFERGSGQVLSDRTAFVIAVVLGGLALTLVLKTAFGFSRPPEPLQAVPRESSGFPSGHTMAAAILWTALALWSARFTRRSRLLAAAGGIALVAVSRLALGVHYLVDVVASVLFGVGMLLLAARLTRGDPEAAFAGAAVLGTLALIVTGATTDGWLAFVGCVGAAGGWWILNRPRVRALWLSTTQ
ncbi:phosphatase PAP2 family protein [Natrarchaeobaculum sulfurireducens]|uniref:Membrane-associated phospholipid phosphatase n=1 Tax=Natrarchaeobaculum sulfurireducens TaxID=2044521 RepID=A0A346PDX7_9EURY|nr:phosphatase PAP2 family protein [Natrarchaeobaculum sulfurireducens]AXR77722.1 Membrane-associated phospholipid phosphatase [Natrarchaeobaculum sulfurireducens]